jgi:hypothetical protein
MSLLKPAPESDQSKRNLRDGTNLKRLARGRENPEERDDEVDAQVWLEIAVRLASTHGCHRVWLVQSAVRCVLNEHLD